MEVNLQSSAIQQLVRRTCKLMLLAGGLLGAREARAQIAVSSISTYTTTDLANSTTNGATFDNTTVAITTFKDAAGNIYSANTTAGSAYVRRDTTDGNSSNASVWYADGSPSGSSPAGSFGASNSASYSSLLLGNNILRGSDNTFANGTDPTTSNIERLDFLFNSSGITATTSTGFAIFDRGVAGQHDGVEIAVITGWDSVNNVPTAYGGNLVTVTTANYGATNPIADFNYNLFRYSNGDNVSGAWDSNTETGTQGIGGVVVSLSDLGIAAGTKIYGYSLMAYDTTDGGSVSNLVNWNNTTYYPANTDATSGGGGIDLSAVNGVLYNRAAPEPSTYGAIFLGLTATFFGWRRRRAGQAAV